MDSRELSVIIQTDGSPNLGGVVGRWAMILGKITIPTLLFFLNIWSQAKSSVVTFLIKRRKEYGINKNPKMRYQMDVKRERQKTDRQACSNYNTDGLFRPSVHGYDSFLHTRVNEKK